MFLIFKEKLSPHLVEVLELRLDFVHQALESKLRSCSRAISFDSPKTLNQITDEMNQIRDQMTLFKKIS